MKVANGGTCSQQRPLSGDRLGRYVQRNVEHEPISYREQRAKKADVVLNVLEDIEAKKQLEVFMNVFWRPDSQINSVVAFDQFYCLRRRIVAHESRSL